MTGLHRLGLATALAALVCCTAAVVGGPGTALAVSAGGLRVSPAGRSPERVRANHSAARPGANLLANPGAQAGAASARGWDSVTIPGWQVASGLPTVVRYGTAHFPAATGKSPALPGGQLFAGGAGGTARLRQAVPLRSAAGSPVPGGTRYRLSAWLGGTARSQALVTVAFVSASGRVLARHAIGPAGAAPPGPGWCSGPPPERCRAGQPAPGSRWSWRRR